MTLIGLNVKIWAVFINFKKEKNNVTTNVFYFRYSYVKRDFMWNS
jgi:hypothetical protein